MSRANLRRTPSTTRHAKKAASRRRAVDSAQIAEDLGVAALELAKRARAAGLTAIGHLLETVALEAGAEAATRQWPADHLKQ